MSAETTTASAGLAHANLAIIKDGGLFLVVCAIAFVMSEPAPYELAMVGLVGLGFLFGLRLPAATAPMVACMVVYILGGMLALTQVPDLDKAPLYMAVSAFLAGSSIFFAAVIAVKPQRIELITTALIVAGTITALLGVMAYFGVIPGSDVFLRYDRARGTFEDPNVFAAFLIMPIAFLMRRLLTGSLSMMPVNMALLGIMTIGVFLSFSRAGWALLILVGLATVMITLVDTPSARVKARAMILTSLAAVGMVLVIMVVLAVSDVADVFAERATLDQSYDVGAFGRFERHWLGMLLVTEKPLGIGPGEFWKTYVEDPHNVYLKGFLAYGWLGGISYLALIGLTFIRWMPILFKPRPWRELGQAYFVVFCLYCVLGWIIDTDHWRHVYLLLGVAWGLIAAEARYGQTYDRQIARVKRSRPDQMNAPGQGLPPTRPQAA